MLLAIVVRMSPQVDYSIFTSGGKSTLDEYLASDILSCVEVIYE